MAAVLEELCLQLLVEHPSLLPARVWCSLGLKGLKQTHRIRQVQ